MLEFPRLFMNEEVKTMKPNPEVIDQIAEILWQREHLKKQDKALTLKLAPLLEPVTDYVNFEYPMDPKIPRRAQTAKVPGNVAELNFGKQRDARVLIDQVEALRRLENVREGLGFESISIALKVLDDELRASEVEDLIRHEYKERRIKAVRIKE